MGKVKYCKWTIAVLLGVSVLWGSSANALAAVRLGDSGDESRAVQERLISLGYDVGLPDGVFGVRTQTAVEALQAENGLVVDGIVGEDTWRVLRTAVPQVSRGRESSAVSARIILTAQRYQGVPYVWGGTSPGGFDCSGFTQYVFALNGVNLPRTADVQFEVGIPVRYGQLQPGDLVFFSTYEPGPSHNGIYLGSGRFISASSSRGVAIDRLDSDYWSSRYLGARRVIR
ncbi:cell wall-associated NlpC family hydrolase [Anaerospora hongkongensis]|uniref:Cell wall-associated NlpC family hydrolase n=1 Tax=Anaerospora hongkongensis TaxID=244830 RepID=A0A4R1Q162_9FIRM|nr:cell wall-associated NlpC family hydrolase [Anaerospora hongkongensis]